jgi:hypothetical protein
MDKRPCTPMKGAVNCTPNQLARFISSLALGEGSLPTSSLATGLCAPLRSTPTASGCFCNARPMGASPGSPSLETCGSSTATPGATMSMSSAPGSPVSPGVSQESAQAQRTSATSGLIPTACFARYDPATHCLRTSQGSLFSPICDEYSQTLPPHGMMRSGQCWALTTWALPTAGNASGYSWPTPNVPNGGRTTWHAEQEGNSFYHDGKKVQLGLEQAVRIWATPTHNANADCPSERQRHTPALASAVQMWPTPSATPYGTNQGGSMGREGQPSRPSLETMARTQTWATPSARDWRSGHASQMTLAGNSRPLNEQVTATTGQGQLNPGFVEWLMGWPKGWTAPGRLNGPTSRVWQQVFRTALIAYVPSAMDGCHCVQQ